LCRDQCGDQEIDRQLQSPVAKDWVTNRGNFTNQRYSTPIKETSWTPILAETS
jgi:hypothetical protein